MVTIIDTGTGNLRSLRNALSALGLESRVLQEPPRETSACLVLPGVGAFGHAVGALDERGWRSYLTRAAEAGSRIVGICLGLQLLFERSEESPGAEGLGFIRGTVRRLDASAAKVPHIGWSRLRPSGDEPVPLWAYFVHSYAVRPEEAGVVTAWAGHPEPFPAVVRRGNLAGVQFHPEKSQQPGIAYLKTLLGGEE